jgi:hypothetical protein
MKSLLFLWSLASCVALTATEAIATTFHVGPKQSLKAINDVPWEALKAGDEVLIDWRPEPYKEKWVICCKGTEKEPIVVRGIPGEDGKLPVIDGNGARTRQQLNFWGDVRGIVKIGGAMVPKGSEAQYILLENLEIRGARAPYTFIDSRGETKAYTVMASAIYVEKAHHLTIRHCTLADSSQGLFVSSNDDSASSDILVEKCHFYDNGAGSRSHSIYTAAAGITFQYNHLGPLRTNCIGNNLKDRSAGLVVRYNWIEGGDKQLDLVDAEDSAIVRKHLDYRKTFVYGNIFIKPPTAAHNQVVHYGGDSSREEIYRKGTLYFYNNTVISYRKDPMNLFWLSSNDEHCDFRNNIVYSATNGKFSPLKDNGTITLSHNLLPENWTNGKSAQDDGTSIKQADPGFTKFDAQNFELSANSKARNTGTTLAKEAVPAQAVLSEYEKHQQSRTRPQDRHLDIGAYEFHP